MAKSWMRAVPAVASALLLFLSFHPANLWPLAWGALAPLMAGALLDRRGGRAFLVAWLGGFLFFTAALFWIRHTASFGPWGIGLYKGLYWGLFVLILRRLCLRGGWPIPLAAPAAWVGLEFLRSYLFGGLPYLLIGYTQHEALGVIQIADLGGVWLVSLLIVFVNGVAARAMIEPKGHREWARAVLAVLAAVLAYGSIRLGTIELEDGPVVGIVQPNILQEVKNLSQSDDREADEIYDKHVRLTRELVRLHPEAALVVWPESVLQDGLRYLVDEGRWSRRGRFESIVREVRAWGKPLLAGMLVADIHEREGRRDFANSALLFDGGEVKARYDKMRLVQFSEVMPFASFLPVKDIVKKMTNLPEVFEFRPGREAVTFGAGGKAFGVCICSENFYPDICREIAGKGAAVLVNISNEGWFRDSAELDLMVAMAKFRAVENRVPCVRATNSGISAFLEPTGRVQRVLTGPGGGAKQVEGILAAPVRIGKAGSAYRAVGDAVPWAAAGAALAGLVLAARTRRNVDTEKADA
jgi:apolipoprotein N-acyltransferase